MEPNFRPRAVIFDVDGTLYSQRRMRFCMLGEMAGFLVHRPGRFNDLRILWLFRRMREAYGSIWVEDIEEQQYQCPARRSNTDVETVRNIVREWIFERPLKYLPGCRYKGVPELFCYLKREGISVGVFSDYPASEKLAAMGLTADVAVHAASGEVNRFKPHPKGLLAVASKLKTPVAQCLYIGDRNDKDGECARRAGMPYLILDTSKNKDLSTFSSYHQLRLRFEAWCSMSSVR